LRATGQEFNPSSRKGGFKYIQEPEPGEAPNFPKSAAFKSPSEKIVEEFIHSGLELAKVKLPPGKKNPAAMARGISKILNRKPQTKGVYAARLDFDRNIWIFKK
jgi:hypothetical protein